MPPLEFDRYLGSLSLQQISIAGQKKISSKKVAIVGVGGTGGVAAELLARSGVAEILIIDDDSVSLTNLQRQVEYAEPDLGKKKAEILKSRLERINRNVVITAKTERLTIENSTIIGKPDLIFDGTDNYSARNAINRYAVRNKIPWIMTAASETFGTIKAVLPHITSCTACLGYPETGNEGVGCAQIGILPSTPAVIGSLAISISLRILMEEAVEGDVIYIDTWNYGIERIKTVINPACKVCGIA
ncbi:MAG: HesA/MoeB/ThiF family protein [Thermoplasmataceae archaeon]